MQPKFILINDTYINENEIRKIKRYTSSTGTLIYCIYLTDNSKEVLSYPTGRTGESYELRIFENWLNSSLHRI